MQSHVHYFNVDFDLKLAEREPSPLRRATAEATMYALVMGNPHDRVILDSYPDRAYGEYLRSHGIDPPLPVGNRDRLSRCTPAPWGWNEEAVARFRALGISPHHPPLDVVRRVNARDFCFSIATRRTMGVPGGRMFTDERHLRDHLRRDGSFPCVVKPMHGNSGIGFLVVHSVNDLPDRNDLRNAPRPTGTVIVEPWLDRMIDMSTGFTLMKDGGMRGLSHHRTFNSANGVFYGIDLTPGDDSLAPWREQLDNAAREAAGALHREGYFGHVGIDSFVFKSRHGGSELAAMVEINARQTMSTLARCLRERLAPGRHCRFLLVPSGRYRTIESYDHLRSALKESAFRPAERKGIFTWTPLRFHYNSAVHPPRRLGFFIAADNADDIGHYESHLRATLGKPGNES